jgi:hypothetical protein
MTNAITARGTIGGLLAVLALASTVAVGLNLASPGHASPKPASAVAAASVGVPSQASLDTDFRRVVHGHC